MAVRRATARSPSFDTSAADNLPISFDSELELTSVLDRLRADLAKRVRQQWDQAGANDQSMLEEAEKIVLEDFWDSIVPTICANTSIAGRPYNKYKSSSSPSVPTEPFNQDLHDRVTRYQNELFDIRVDNVKQRVALPAEVGNDARVFIEHDQKRLAVLEQDAARPYPEPVVAHVTAKPRRSIGGRPLEPDAAVAIDAFNAGKADIDRLLDDVPRLKSSADEARKVALEASTLSRRF